MSNTIGAAFDEEVCSVVNFYDLTGEWKTEQSFRTAILTAVGLNPDEEPDTSYMGETDVWAPMASTPNHTVRKRIFVASAVMAACQGDQKSAIKWFRELGFYEVETPKYLKYGHSMTFFISPIHEFMEILGKDFLKEWKGYAFPKPKGK